jgi:hypothetical protein
VSRNAYEEVRTHTIKLETDMKEVQESIKALKNTQNVQAAYLGDTEESLANRVKELEDKHQDLMAEDKRLYDRISRRRVELEALEHLVGVLE